MSERTCGTQSDVSRRHRSRSALRAPGCGTGVSSSRGLREGATPGGGCARTAAPRAGGQGS
eukprot:7390580-Prymnesium_polylepis.2